MRRHWLAMGLALSIAIPCLTACGEQYPPVPQWCQDLSLWQADVYPLVDRIEKATTLEASKVLANELGAVAATLYEYPELAAAYEDMIEAVTEAGVTGTSEESVAAAEVMWDAYSRIEEPCPGPFM